MDSFCLMSSLLDGFEAKVAEEERRRRDSERVLSAPEPLLASATL